MSTVFIPNEGDEYYQDYHWHGYRREVLVNGKKYTLLPIVMIEIGTLRNRTIVGNDIRRLCTIDRTIPLIAKSYADYYSGAGIGETWTEESAKDFLEWLDEQSSSGLFVDKWALDEEGNLFPVGFFGAYMKPYGRGKTLWDGDLFVKPEFQRLGIGKELIEVLLIKARQHGITEFEALTYDDGTGHPKQMWESLGADATDLIHIAGSVDQMEEAIQKKK